MKTYGKFNVHLMDGSKRLVTMSHQTTIALFREKSWPTITTFTIDEENGIGVPWHGVCWIEGVE